MINKYHILPFFYSKDWKGLIRHLSQLSNMDFRRAEKMVREEILPGLAPADYWTAMLHLVMFNKSAFITGITALERVSCHEDFSFASEEAKAFAKNVKESIPETIAKIANIALPMLTKEEQIDGLFNLLSIESERDRLAYLIKVESPLTYFALFKTLKMMPDNQELVHKCCVYIMKRNNDISFNMASILRAYFDIAELKSQLSLKIDTYELNYIDRNYETFLHVLNGKRPKV